MVIINADDWGKTRRDTDAAVACFERGRITCVSAMVFMEDSARAAAIAVDKGIDAGLHLNLTERFTAPPPSGDLMIRHERVARSLTANRYSFLLYHPRLTSDLHYLYRAQFEEFARLYGRPPAHIDGHHHQHLCTNMLVDGIIAKGSKVRRSFHFWPDEKSWPNRIYRRVVDRLLARNYKVTDYFFALPHCMQPPRMERVEIVAETASVEIMTHPVHADEYSFLMSDAFASHFAAKMSKPFSAL